MTPLTPMEIEQVAGAGAPSLADLAALFSTPSANDMLLKLVINNPAAASSAAERLALQKQFAQANDAALQDIASKM